MSATSDTGAANDLIASCFTCEPLQKYVDLTTDFSDKLSSALNEPMFILFTSLFGLWAVVAGYRLALKQADIMDLIKDLIYITITGVILASQSNGLISYVYSSALTVMSGSANTAFSVASGELQSTGQTGLVALAANGELAIAKVIQAASAIARAGALYNIANYIYAIVLVVPYFLLIVAYSSQVVVAIFRAMMVGIFAPFLFMSFAFGWGRQMAFSGAKTLLAAIMVLFACTAALALTIYGVNTVNLQPETLTGDALNKFASMSNPDFLVILFLGWMGTALMTEGTSMANSIAGTMLSNTAAGIMTAGAVATGAAVLKASRTGAGFLGNLGMKNHDRMWGGGDDKSKGVQDKVDKFNNINKPGGDAS